MPYLGYTNRATRSAFNWLTSEERFTANALAIVRGSKDRDLAAYSLEHFLRVFADHSPHHPLVSDIGDFSEVDWSDLVWRFEQWD